MSESSEKRIERIDRISKEEKLRSPQMIQKNKAVRPGGGGNGGTQVYLAQTTMNAYSSIIITCQLYDPVTGVLGEEEVDVYCSIVGGADYLNEATPRLFDGDKIFVAELMYEGTKRYYCLTVFMATKPCICYEG